MKNEIIVLFCFILCVFNIDFQDKPKASTEPPPMCIPKYYAERINKQNELKSGKPEIPKPTPLPLSTFPTLPCTVSEQYLNTWVAERLTQKLTQRIQTSEMYSNSNAVSHAKNLNIYLDAENKTHIDPGMLFYLAWAESGGQKNALAPSSSAASYFQIIWETGLKLPTLVNGKQVSLIRPSGKIIEGYKCNNRNSKGRCIGYGLGQCQQVIDGRFNLQESAIAIGLELSKYKNKFPDRSYIYWMHHYPKAPKELPGIVAAQLNSGLKVPNEQVFEFLKKQGVTNAYRLTAGAVKCGGRAGEAIKRYPDGSATYTFTVAAAGAYFDTLNGGQTRKTIEEKRKKIKKPGK